MNHSQRRLGFAASAALVALVVSGAHASDFTSSNPSVFGFTPKVPISALARPAGWFDPSRLHLSTSVTVGSGFGSGAQGLQVTSLSYQFRAPVWMRVNVGNAWGSASTANSSLFLEGLDVGVRPFTNFQIQVHYRDFRTPLQYGAYNPIYRPYGWDE
jgi:hypothetical protein